MRSDRISGYPAGDRRNSRASRWALSTIPALAFFLVYVNVVFGESSSSIHHSISHTTEGCIVRGGETSLPLEGRYPAIDAFLAEQDPKESMKRFHIHGWRWHTASLVRESGRLCNLAKRTISTIEDNSSMPKALQQAADYVVGFSMKGLHRIEADLMFPWMREKLTTSELVTPEASKEFANVMNRLERDRQKLVEFGESIVRALYGDGRLLWGVQSVVSHFTFCL